MKLVERDAAIDRIEESDTVLEANEELESYLGKDKTIEEKIAFLKKEFDVSGIELPNDNNETLYWRMLSAIIQDY